MKTEVCKKCNLEIDDCSCPHECIKCTACIKPNTEQLKELIDQSNEIILKILQRLPLIQVNPLGSEYKLIVAAVGALQGMFANVMKEGKTYGDLKNLLNSYSDAINGKQEEVKNEDKN